MADIAGAVADQLAPPFRGEIWEFFKDVPMERGFANEGRPFNIETAFYLTEVMREIRRRPFGKFVNMAAVQTLKTNGTIEQPAGYFIANDPGDMAIYFPGDESAFDQGKTRLMPYIRSSSSVARIIDNVLAAGPDGRFNITTDELYLPGMTLRIWPLNKSSTQRITLRYVLISDAFLSGRTGLLKEAIARKTAHDNVTGLRDYKVIIESQGGEEDDDFDSEWKTTDQRILHVACPLCATSQPFEWHRPRPDDFIATPPTDIVSLDRQAWIEHWTPILKKEDRRHAGMKRGDSVKRDDGAYDDREILRQTYYECYHCSGAWRDIPETRRKIDHSSTYVASNPSALPENIGHWWPAWCGQRLAWGGIMLEYLQAKRSASMGNYDPLKQWHQKKGARTWSSAAIRPVIEISPGSYDPVEQIPDEYCRNMGVDCQQDQDHFDRTGQSITGWFWYWVDAVDKMGNTRQLARGFCKSWEAWIAVQQQWKVPNDRVVIDIGHWPDLIIQRAAAERQIVKLEKPMMPFNIREKVATWLLLAGDPTSNRISWKHADGKYRPYSPPQPVMATVFEKDGTRKVVHLKKILWSNVAFKMQLDAIRSGAPGMPKFEFLDRSRLDEMTLQMESGVATFDQQMQNEFYALKNGKDHYSALAGRKDVHYRDLKCMLLVRQAIDGMLGHLAITQPPSHGP